MALTQKEIIDREQTNTDSVWLYLEGSFYKAYERSAFAFCTRIKDYKVLRKESKTLGRDILYVGFPMTALDRTLGNAMTRRVDEVVIDVMLSYPINENEFFQWRDAQEVEQASRALLSPYTKVIEKSPVYKTAYDILTQIVLISGNISKNCQVRFERDLSRNLILLYAEVRDRTYRPERSMCFIIKDPVQREVFAASFRDRIIHHYLYNQLEPVFEPAFIYDSYSCRKGKGTLFGIERLEHHIRSCSENYHKQCFALKLAFNRIDRILSIAPDYNTGY